MNITVLTPTYNRAENLVKLYKSLCEQTNKNFLWMIIDDGSTDNTEELIKNIKSEKKINIEYLKKKNGGKHTALNLGIKNIKTDLIFIVDSDDWLDKNAIANIEITHEKYKFNKEICGYSYLRKFPDNEINGKYFPENYLIGSYIDVRINGNDMNADKAEVWKTSCLLQYPFPEFKGEKFLGEDVVWIQMALKYNMVHINKAIYIGDYLEEGLTKNRRKQNIKSPKGCLLRAKLCMHSSINIKFRLKSIIQYGVYGKIAGYNFYELYLGIEYKIYYILLFPIIILYYIKWIKNIKLINR